MSELEKLQKENKNLKCLLEEVYEMSFIDYMINDECRDRKDDEMLLCHLSLKSQIMEALEKKESPLEDLKKSINGKEKATA